MRLLYPILFIFTVLHGTRARAQAPITVEDMQSWHRIQNEQFGPDGRFVVYSLTKDVGDPITVTYDARNERETRYPRLHDPALSYDGRYLVGTLQPSRDTVLHYKRQEREKELKKMDTLLVIDLTTGQQERYPEVYDVRLPERATGIVAYTTASSLPDSLRGDLPDEARRLMVRRLGSLDSFFLEGVEAFRTARDEPIVLARRAAKDSSWTDGVLRLDPTELEWQTLSEGPATYAGLTLSYDGTHAAFLSREKNQEAKQPPFHLHYWTEGNDSARAVTTENMAWLPRGYRVSDDRRPTFSEDGRYLFFGTTPRRPELDSSDIASELADVEVWTTDDPRLYTRQNYELKQDRSFTYLAAYRTARNDFLQLATPEYPETSRPEEGRGRYVLLYNDTPYRKATMWMGSPTPRDLTIIDLQTGRRTPVAEGEPGFYQWSPDGNYLAWYNPQDTAYYAYDVAAATTRQLTTNELGTFYDELNDRPMDPYPYGIAGWYDDGSLVVNDRYDLWRLDAGGQDKPERLTRGRETETEYRYVELDRENPYLPDRLLLQTQRMGDYAGGMALLAEGEVRQLVAGPAVYRNFLKARAADRYVYTRESYAEFPNLRLTDELDELGSPGAPISDANPQQDDFGFGMIEEYRWIDHEGRELRGMLVKPPNFDSTRQYPLLVNFYERSSEGIHRHRTPVPGRSSINYPHYASRGYVIFNPDIVYRRGYPGESAYNCAMSGISSLLTQGFIDRERIGLQGHSWGGYQAAYLATKTDLFAAIESGAPVVNMFSAYGGIRWGSGLSRQFQYERTQSRIGGTPWKYPLRYLENSPLFFADKINTPILILHNDEDGAVPWYQGIEFFTALRRLGKRAWMLNYRGEPHWPVKPPNRADFQTRMAQFFDYYLLGEPMPRWMREGVSPLERGIEQNLELTTD